MDKEIRNRIQRATQAARALLEREYAEQLEGTFDIRLDGTIAAEPGGHLDAQHRVLRTKLVAAVEHVRSSVVGRQSAAEAVTGYLREAAFTTLNRFVALKMLEARGLVQECISRGEQSAGFKEFTGLAPGLAQLPSHGYRLYIESLFDEIGCEVRVLFDRRDPASLLWPRRPALQQLLDILNDPDLSRLTTEDGRPTTIWHEDETIGWVYQYFNSDEERRQMRAESQAPRNSRELAVRNQFFTPRYVVEFLTDNTLGRIWYEMRQGKTRLVDECDYLVRRPTEIFLAEGASAPEDDSTRDENLSQEELLKKPATFPSELRRTRVTSRFSTRHVVRGTSCSMRSICLLPFTKRRGRMTPVRSQKRLVAISGTTIQPLKTSGVSSLDSCFDTTCTASTSIRVLSRLPHLLSG